MSLSHKKRVERSTDRNLPPIFTKLATKVESQEIWLPIVFLVEILNIFIRQTGSGINPHHCISAEYGTDMRDEDADDANAASNVAAYSVGVAVS